MLPPQANYPISPGMEKKKVKNVKEIHFSGKKTRRYCRGKELYFKHFPCIFLNKEKGPEFGQAQ